MAQRTDEFPPDLDNPDFLDLQVGWRLRVTEPLKAGGYHLQPASEEMAGSTIALSVDESSFAYETAFYLLQSRSDGSMEVRFVSAETATNGKSSQQSTPRGWQPQLPAYLSFARLLFLRRLSGSDHDMAIIAARSRVALDGLTRALLTSPEASCSNNERSACSWIPAGVAVVAERQTGESGASWVPVR